MNHLYAAGNVQNIKATAINEIINKHQDIVILDIRTGREFQEFTLPEAINIDSLDQNFEKNLATFVASHPDSRLWMVYCRSGNRSSRAMSILERQLPGMIYHVQDGIIAYKKTDQPVCKDSSQNDKGKC